MDVNLKEIMDEETQQITQKMAGIQLKPVERELEDNGHLSSLSAQVDGHYTLSLVYHAEDTLLRSIAERMKRSDVANEEEVAMYTKEFFNILCGRIVSRFNNAAKTSGRFGIPKYVRGVYMSDLHPSDVIEICYHSCDGNARIWGAFKEDQDGQE